jgi:hypothetical protein
MESTKETKAISLLGSDRPPYRFGGTSVKAVKADDIDDTQSAINVRSVDPGVGCPSLLTFILPN